MKRIIILALLSFLLGFKSAWAQFSFGVRVMTMYDDNVNSNHLGLSDKVALLSQLTQSFTTKTMLILEADLGAKIYTSANLEETASMSRGRGQGGRTVTAARPKVTQFTGIARLGQGLVAGTGLSLTAQYQFNLQKDSRYLSSEYGFISDDELFDDHYGYEGPQMSVMLTQLLPAGTVMKISGGMQERNYSERPAYDLAGIQIADERADKRRAFSAQLEKSFKTLGLSLGLVYDYIRSHSNDLFYDYANNAFTAQLSLGY